MQTYIEGDRGSFSSLIVFEEDTRQYLQHECVFKMFYPPELVQVFFRGISNSKGIIEKLRDDVASCHI